MVDDMLRTGEWRQFMIIPVANLAVAAVQGVAATRSLQRGMLLISDLTPCRGYKFRAGLIKASTGVSGTTIRPARAAQRGWLSRCCSLLVADPAKVCCALLLIPTLRYARLWFPPCCCTSTVR
jgi:hypothetical protein